MNFVGFGSLLSFCLGVCGCCFDLLVVGLGLVYVCGLCLT